MTLPIAIVGFAFRFPGDLGLEAELWDALMQGRDLVGRVPSDRWAVDELAHPKRSEPGKSISFAAGVLSRIDEFDAGFFGISPREAAWLDPQQRLLLELAWESMENAGCPPSRLAGSDCAVYVGISGLDYGTRGLDDLASMSAHTMTGNTLSVAANRLSYVFDLHGPSLAVDTACSSSLVALHHACNALRSGEASSALVGGVNMLLHPYPFVGFTKASMLSADGRCKAFDASGNGYVRAEGGAVLLLKPLERALADGDKIHAVILASGANADGSRKTGITIPSADGQAELMQQVLRRSGLSAQDVDFIEAHGTGTMIGDPVETAAIGRVYGPARSEPLPIGSVKANLGHLESASGMAGLVKTIVALKRGELPPSLHLNTPNPNIDFDGLNLRLITEPFRLSAKAGKPLIAGVNSFGFGGANAHVLLSAAPIASQGPVRDGQVLDAPLFLSARSDAALRALAARYADLLAGTPAEARYDVAWSAAMRREWLDKRLVLHSVCAEHSVATLRAFADGSKASSGVSVDDSLPVDGGVAFVYAGNGSQWLGMGRSLLAESPRFADLMTALDRDMLPHTGFSVLHELQADDATSRLDDTVVAQPLLFAMQLALTQLLADQGIKPDAVVGHSVGEVAAAWAAGGLDRAKAIRVISARSQAQGLTRGRGRMAAVALSAEKLREHLAVLGLDGELELAGINSPRNVTVSGALDALKKLQSHLKTQGVVFRLLGLDYAFHSRQMDPVKAALAQSLQGFVPAQSAYLPFVSTVTGGVLEASALDADYWWRNVREPVQFASAVEALIEQGCRVFVEIGPHAILQRYVSESLVAASMPGRVLPTLKKGDDGVSRLNDSVMRVHLLSRHTATDRYFQIAGRFADLPNYPWQRERHWQPRTSEGLLAIERRRVHPLLGWRLHDADMAWENTLDPQVLSWLVDHKVGGAIVFPAAGFVEMALAAAREWRGLEHVLLEQFDIVAPMVFDGEHARTLRLSVNTRDGSLSISSRQRLSQDPFTVHAAGRLIEPAGAGRPAALAVPAVVETRIDHQQHYALAHDLGLDYGPAFQGVFEARLSGDMLEADVRLPVSLDLSAYVLHPGVLDACFQSLIDYLADDVAAGHGLALLPVRAERVEVFRTGVVHSFLARFCRTSPRSARADFELFDEDGCLIASARACRFRAAPLKRAGSLGVDKWIVSPWLRPHPHDDLYSALSGINDPVEVLRHAFVSLGDQRDVWFRQQLPLIEALVLSFAYEAFRHLQQSDPANWQTRLNTAYARWLAGLLAAEGLLSMEDGWSLSVDADLPPADELWRVLLRDSPGCLPQLALIGRVGRQLPGLLTGGQDAVSFLDGLRHASAAEALYSDDPVYLGTRVALQSALSEFAVRWPATRRLRVLEFSPGLSDLPTELVAALPEDRFAYVVAVPDETLQGRQHAEYPDQANVYSVVFDVASGAVHPELLPVERFDVIIFRHVLHRSLNISAALERARGLLAPGGALLLAERHADWSADFVGGLDPLWWREDATAEASTRAPLSALYQPEAWRQALLQAGFDACHVVTEPAADSLSEGAFIITAQCGVVAAIEPAAPQSARWCLVCDDESALIADELNTYLTALSQSVEVLGHATLNEEDLAGAEHLVLLLGWGDSPRQVAGTLSSVISTLSALPTDTGRACRLWMITREGAMLDAALLGRQASPAQSALWGFGRVLMNERPELACTLIDLPEAHGVELLERLSLELLWPDGANEVVLTQQARYVPMLQSLTQPAAAADASGVGRFRLEFLTPGQLRNLVWLSDHSRPLQADQVEVQTCATGLNFRDVMYLMGLLPDEAVENGFAGASLGLEFSGRILRVGAAVSDFQPGDAVMGFGASCFASHVVTRADALAPMPESWSFEAAATVPTVFFTVYYALKQLADLQAGERVLIHGAAGGVGIAAIQLAKHLGAEVFATAGSDDKRDFVTLLGADRVFDSRSLAFADDVMKATAGQGVDVVLNSLAGEAMRRSLDVLSSFGRFLELGKRDFFENTPVGMRPFRNNISYFGIDADQLLTARPALAARLFREVMALFHDGVLAPLPYRNFTADRVVEAFRCMQQARHIGKVVVSMEDGPPTIRAATMPKAPDLPVSAHKTWLVSGGTAGFGLATAQWLVGRGVKHLALIGRRGVDTPGIQQALERFAEQGVQVVVLACDIANEAAVHKTIASLKTSMPVLEGVVHAAAVYDDRLIANLDEQSLNTALDAKLGGAWNLHLATLDIPLSHFLLYSSITTSIGNPGQANYVAANAGLEGLAAMRRAGGLPATCVAWGPIEDAGYLTRNEAVRDSLAKRLGRPPLLAAQAMDQLPMAMLSSNAVLTVANFDWHALVGSLPSSQSPRFEVLNRDYNESSQRAGAEDLRALIAGKSAEEVSAVIRQMIIEEIAQVLCIKPERIEPGKSLHELGMDSLMAVELALGLEQRFAIQLPVMMLNDAPTADKVTARIVEKLMGEDDDSKDGSSVGDQVAALAQQHGEEVSAEELEDIASQVNSLAAGTTRLSA